MTSDFENDEIKDAAFPVEFTDAGTSLDMYGVWVKNGPRDAPRPELNVTEKTDIALADEKITLGTDKIPETNDDDVSKNDELPDLPDFSTPITDIDSETISFEEIDTSSMLHLESNDSIASKPENVVVRKIVSDSEFNAVDASEFLDNLEITVDSNDSREQEISNSSDSDVGPWDTDIVFEDIHPDELKVSSKKHLQHEEIPSPAPAKKAKNQGQKAPTADFEDISLEFIDTMEPIEPENISSKEEIVFAETNDIAPKEEVVPAEFDSTFPDFSIPEIEVPAFVSEYLTESDGDVSGAETLTEDISSEEQTAADDDFSSFLDDLNSGVIESTPRPTTSPDSLDLDSFIDTFNESGGVSHENSAELYDDIEPVDLELEFDEAFLEDAEKIRATGSSVTESEFFNSEFGVELIDETESESDFLDDIQTPGDLNMPIESVESPPPATENLSGASGFEDTSEFDDLLKTLDLAPTPAQSKTSDSVRQNKPKAFDLIVTDDDGMNSVQPSVAESSPEDMDVPLFGTISQEQTKIPESPYIEENLDIPVIRDYNDTESGSKTEPSVPSVVEENMAPDFDDISAVEQELNDLTPDTGDEAVVNNDKSTELLMIIADELSSIKKEITTLKSELSTFKAAGLTAEPCVQPESDKTTENSGFFSDDDTDETIALTGDELNNILITADFTEEKNNDEEASTNIEALAPPSEEIAQGSFEQDLKVDDLEIPETLPDSIYEVPQLDSSTPIEAIHLTTIEDDVSYLEGSEIAESELDNVAIEEPDLETIDFNDEKLEEPELTEFNIDLSNIETNFAEGQDVPVPAEESAPDAAITMDQFNIETEPVAIDFSASAPENNEPVVEEPILEEAGENETVVQAIPDSVSSVPDTESSPVTALPVDLKNEIKSVLSYMDQLLESLPEEKIEEFARSEHFEVYKKLFEELGIS